jgi:hypothetical protein
VAATYCNHEAVPESEEVHNPFLDVDLFRINPRLLQERGGTEAARFIRDSEFYFRSYTTGKSAVRLGGDAVPPFGCHRFQLAAGRRHAEVTDPCILHYCECGFARYWRKYEVLGPFEDKYYGRFPVESWKLRSRDLRLAGDEAGARDLYKARVVADPARVADWINLGVCGRFRGPARVLAAAAGGPRQATGRRS